MNLCISPALQVEGTCESSRRCKIKGASAVSAIAPNSLLTRRDYAVTFSVVPFVELELEDDVEAELELDELPLEKFPRSCCN